MKIKITTTTTTPDLEPDSYMGSPEKRKGAGGKTMGTSGHHKPPIVNKFFMF